MTTTTVTTGSQSPSLLAGLAVGAALVVGGILGVAWQQDNGTLAASQAPSYAHSYTRWFDWVTPVAPADLVGSFSGTTHPYPRGWSATGSGLPQGYSTSQGCRGCLP